MAFPTLTSLYPILSLYLPIPCTLYPIPTHTSPSLSSCSHNQDTPTLRNLPWFGGLGEHDSGLTNMVDFLIGLSSQDLS